MQGFVFYPKENPTNFDLPKQYCANNSWAHEQHPPMPTDLKYLLSDQKQY